MTPELADKIMTRIIARVEADGGVLHKSSGIEEIIGTCAVAEAEGEVIDIISHDGKQWVHRDGTAFDVNADHAPVEIGKFSAPSGWVTTIKNLGSHEVVCCGVTIPPGCTAQVEN